MAQEFIDSAKIDSIIRDKKAKGELVEFTAEEVVKLSVKMEMLPCMKGQNCPSPKPLSRIKGVAIGAGYGGAGGLVVIVADIIRRLLVG